MNGLGITLMEFALLLVSHMRRVLSAHDLHEMEPRLHLCRQYVLSQEGCPMPALDAPLVRQSGLVLTTWNLLNSAAVFQDPNIKSVPLVSIKDLAALIDLYCFYDEAALVGRGMEKLVQHLDLHDALSEADFLRTIQERSDRVVTTWAKHLALFMADEFDVLTRADQYRTAEEPWYAALFDHVNQASRAETHASDEYTKRLLSGAVDSSILALVDTPDNLEIDDPILSTPTARRALISELLFEGKQWSRIHTFVLRTFLYLAYADVDDLPFVPDTTRQHIVASMAVQAEEFRGKLARELQIKLSEAVASSVPRGEIFHDVPPLSAIVFERAGSDRRRIVPEMVTLRRELAPLRERLRRIEHEMLFGTASQSKDAEGKWNSAVQEVTENFGLGPRLLSWRGAAKLSEQLGDAIDNPTTFASWSNALVGLPAEVVSRLVRRRTLVGLHRLKEELPAAGRLSETIGRLFSPW